MMRTYAGYSVNPNIGLVIAGGRAGRPARTSASWSHCPTRWGNALLGQYRREDGFCAGIHWRGLGKGLQLVMNYTDVLSYWFFGVAAM